MTSEGNATQGWRIKSWLAGDYEVWQLELAGVIWADFIPTQQQALVLAAALQRPSREAALIEALRWIEFLREYVGGYEGLQTARGYPPTKEADQKGVELTAFITKLKALISPPGLSTG